MADEEKKITLEQRVQRGRIFKEFLEDQRTVGVFNLVRADLINRWRTTDKPEIAKELWHRMRGLETLQQGAQGYVADGELASQERDRKHDIDTEGYGSSPLVGADIRALKG